MIYQLYGLKQSPCQWHKRFDHFILTVDYFKNEYDSYVQYFKVFDNYTYIYLLLVYVNDIYIATKDIFELSKEFDI